MKHFRSTVADKYSYTQGEYVCPLCGNKIAYGALVAYRKAIAGEHEAHPEDPNGRPDRWVWFRFHEDCYVATKDWTAADWAAVGVPAPIERAIHPWVTGLVPPPPHVPDTTPEAGQNLGVFPTILAAAAALAVVPTSTQTPPL